MPLTGRRQKRWRRPSGNSTPMRKLSLPYFMGPMVLSVPGLISKHWLTSRMLLSKPVIGAISGYAVAGGLELALWCDLRIVEEDAVFGVFCRRWGVPLIDGGTVRLPRIIGLGRAMDLILSGRAVAADEAYVMGLANRIVARGSARKEAEALAHEMAQFPQHCLRNDRLSVYEQQGLTLEDALQNEFERSVESLQVDGLKGAAQFAQGRGRHGVFGKL